MMQLPFNPLKQSARTLGSNILQQSTKRSARVMTMASTSIKQNTTTHSTFTLRTGAAAAALCCIYSIDHMSQQSKRGSLTTKNEAPFRLSANQSFQFVNELAQEAKKGLMKRCMTSIIKTGESKVSLKGVDFSKITPAKARSIIQALHAGRVLDGESLVHLSKACTDVFLHESTVVDLRQRGDKITVVGDVHGSLPCLKRVLELAGNLTGDEILVVAGDYVDRGEHSIEVLCTFLLLKLAYPSNVVLLRGNHEDNEICSEYGFADELKQKYGASNFDSIWTSLSDVFASLPICARTDNAIILHGGLPSKDFKLSDLEAVSAETRFKLKTLTDAKNAEEKLLEGILWSDPSPRKGVQPNERGYGIEFGPDVARDFLERHDLRCIIRSHEHVQQGTQVLDCGEGREVVTVFSTANYPCGEGDNAAAVLKLHQDGNYQPVTFTYSDLNVLDAFNFLDTDGSGSVDRQKLLTGVELFNRHHPEERHLKADELFKTLDVDGKGHINLNNFSRYFQVL